MTGADRTCAQLYAWLAALWMVLQLFFVFDWDHGLVRLLLLAIVGGWLLLFRRHAPRFAATASPPARWDRVARTLFALGAAANAGIALVCLTLSAWTGHVRSDQAESVVNALHVFEQGINPYAASTTTDMVGYGVALDALSGRPECRASNEPVRFRLGHADATVVPAIRSLPECDGIARLFRALGFKYGPVTLFLYWPFNVAFGAAGFVVAHTLVGFACVWWLWRWARSRSRSLFWTANALLLFTWPTHLAWNTLVNEHLDLLPVALALAAFLCFADRRFALGAVCLGLSIGAKTLPGLLFVPLLAAGPRRGWIVLAGVLLLVFGPFAAWDWIGLWHNFGYPFMRPPDSTSALMFLPETAGRALQAAAAIAAAALAIRAHRAGWSGVVTAEFLVGSHVALLAAGTTFHNNYLVWLLPVFTIYVLNELVSKGDWVSCSSS